MEKKLTRRESRETAFLTAFAATFEPEEPTLPAEEHPAPDAAADAAIGGTVDFPALKEPDALLDGDAVGGDDGAADGGLT